MNEYNFIQKPDGSKQSQLFFEHYRYELKYLLESYSVTTNSVDNTSSFKHTEKSIYIEDLGDKITSNFGDESIEEKVRLMLDIVQGKNWDIEKLSFSGDDAFMEEMNKQVSAIKLHNENLSQVKEKIDKKHSENAKNVDNLKNNVITLSKEDMPKEEKHSAKIPQKMIEVDDNSGYIYEDEDGDENEEAQKEDRKSLKDDFFGSVA